MFAYHVRMALKSLLRNPILSALMVGAIALGVGVTITTLTVHHLMSGNPIAYRNDVLYAVTLDTWSPVFAIDESRPELPPPQLTYRDAMALLASDIPSRSVAMYRAASVIDAPEGRRDVKPFLVVSRLTTHAFFAMFDVPFRYGGGWDSASDEAATPVVVLSRETNDKAFGGENSVGRSIEIDGREYRVVGVLDDWLPTPKFYDLNSGAFDEPEDVFLPLSVGVSLEQLPSGNVNCWKNEPLDSFGDFLGSECVWTQFWAELAGDAEGESFQAFIDAYAGEQKQLGRFQRPLNNRLQRVDQWLDVNEVVRDDNRVLVGLSVIFLVVCLLNMIGLLLAKFMTAAPIVALRRALGASRAAVFHQHLVEVSIIGLAGGLLGLALAALALQGVQKLYENYERLSRLDVEMVIAALGIAVLSSIAAGIYPTLRICLVQPAGYLKTQ